MYIEHLSPTTTLYPPGDTFHSFRSTIICCAEISGVWGFSVCYNGERELPVKYPSKYQYFCKDNWKENSGEFGIIGKRYVGGVAFWTFCSHLVPCLRKRKNIVKFKFAKFQNSETVLLWWPLTRKFRRSLEKNSRAISWSVMWDVLLPLGPILKKRGKKSWKK